MAKAKTSASAHGEQQKRSGKPAGHDVARLEERTQEELYQLAKDLHIPGHMDMTRPELIEAIRRR